MLIELLLQAGWSSLNISLFVLWALLAIGAFGGLADAVIYVQWQRGKW